MITAAAVAAAHRSPSTLETDPAFCLSPFLLCSGVSLLVLIIIFEVGSGAQLLFALTPQFEIPDAVSGVSTAVCHRPAQNNRQIRDVHLYY